MHDPHLRVVDATGDAGVQQAGVPSDNTTLTSVLDELVGEGFTSSFVSRPGGRLLCTTCRGTVSADDLVPEQVRRLEGASDPDDEIVVVAAPCPRGGAHGSTALGFGPTASDDDVGVVAMLDLDWD